MREGVNRGSEEGSRRMKVMCKGIKCDSDEEGVR